MNHDTEKYRHIYENLSADEIEEVNRQNDKEHLRQAAAFKKGYAKEICYLCHKPFKTISKDSPCLHWLLRQCKFRKKDFPKIYAKYGYGNIAAFIRWCANQERLLSNINDLEDGRPDRKVLSYTVKWKNIEWTFDCSKNDFLGHKGTAVDFPHYHFQMRIDGKQFINFNDFHVPFTDEDLFVLKNVLEQGDWFKHDFGAIGSGMQAAFSIDPELALEHMSSADEDEAVYRVFSKIANVDGKPISGELINEIIRGAKSTGRPMVQVAKEMLKDAADVETIICPADSIPDIASRTENKRR